jgi:hypothetical protein
MNRLKETKELAIFQHHVVILIKLMLYKMSIWGRMLLMLYKMSIWGRMLINSLEETYGQDTAS